VVPHLVFVLTEVGLRPIETHPINSISLSFVFVEGLNYILNPPKLFLDADVLLARRLCLDVHRKHTDIHRSPNITCRLT